MNEPGGAITRFTFTTGLLRGTHLTLHPTCLVHRGDTQLETLPLAAIGALRVAFERDLRKLGWGIGLVVLALLLLALASPLGGFASAAAADMAAAGLQGVTRGLHAFFRFLEALASLLPALAFLCAVGGAGLCALGWMGRTTLTLSLAGAERVYPARGRDSTLLEFSEAVSERLMLLRR